MNQLIRKIRSLASRDQQRTSSDELLLNRFFDGCDEEEAFAELVRRHGRMVMGACLRIVRHQQDAEDAFQATFLTLARKGAGIRNPSAVGAWLHRVAHHCAMSLATKRRRMNHGELTNVIADTTALSESGWNELQPVLDEEIQRLPEKYRTAIVL